MPEEPFDPREAKVAYCPECGGWITVACFPDCEKRADSRREFSKHAERGDIIKVVNIEVIRSKDHKMCKGHKKPKAKAPDLFAAASH